MILCRLTAVNGGEFTLKLNLPNALSLIRLCMVPIVPLIYFSGVEYANLWTAGVYAVASLTDALDGYIARKYNLITRLGRVLDPLADKCITFCVLICIIITQPVILWAGVIFFLKEAFMGIGALALYKKIKDVPASNILGKTSTIFFFATCFLVLIFPEIPIEIVTAMVAAATLLNLSAFILYLRGYIKNTNKQKLENAQQNAQQHNRELKQKNPKREAVLTKQK